MSDVVSLNDKQLKYLKFLEDGGNPFAPESREWDSLSAEEQRGLSKYWASLQPPKCKCGHPESEHVLDGVRCNNVDYFGDCGCLKFEWRAT